MAAAVAVLATAAVAGIRRSVLGSYKEGGGGALELCAVASGRANGRAGERVSGWKEEAEQGRNGGWRAV